jgi:hypothetical protein
MPDPISPLMSLYLPIPGTTPGPTWASELTANMTTIDTHDHSAGKGAPITAISGGFGSDTLVTLPNASASDVNALELITTLTTNTPGVEASKWVLKLLSAGAQVTALDLRPGQLLAASGLVGAPAYSFQSFPTAGLMASAGIGGNGDVRVVVNGTSLVFFDWQLGIMTAGFGYSYMIGIDALRGFGQNGSGGNLYLFGDKNFQIGANGALNTTATVGYLEIPSCAGAPTGVPSPIGTGKIILHYDSTNNKIYAYNGAWKSTAALT